jgi:multidrug efflux system outer membrane protein
MKRQHSILFFLVIAAIAGCKVGGEFSKPDSYVANTLTQYPQSINTTDSIATMKWWELYQDTVLQRYIRTTLDSNRNLLAAVARVEEAREVAGVVKANLWPAFGYSGSIGGGKSGTEAVKVAGGIEGGAIKAYGTLTWEIDIWGKIRHANIAAYNEFLAEGYNRNALTVSLVSTVAELYFLLRDLDNRLLIAQRTVQSRDTSIRIISERYSQGYVSEIDKLQSEIQKDEAAAVVPQLKQQITLTENAIKTLMAQGPGPLQRGLSLIDQVMEPEIPAGLPSQLLLRRPDIIAAERSLEAQFNRIGVARANMYPSFTLTGLLGFASPQLSTFLGSSGFVANGFAGLAGPIFQFNQNKRFVSVQRYRTEQVLRDYEQTIIGAFSEVDNALAQYRNAMEENEIRAHQKVAAKKALELTRARYDFGYSSYYEVLIQENYLFEAELQESLTLQLKLNALVSLYRALGGGWDVPQ